MRSSLRWFVASLAMIVGLAWLACSHRDDPTPRTSAAGAARIVTLSPSATEVVAALGATSELIGVDDYSTFPPEVAALPKVGQFLSPNLEAIVKLAPTLVIVDDIHGATAGALADAHIATLACPVHTLRDVKAALAKVGDAIGRQSQAAAAIASIDRALDDAAAHRPAVHPRVLVVLDREAGGLGGLVAAGTGSYVDELLAVIGGDNIVAAAGVAYPKISLEEVLRGAPDVILDLSFAGKQSAAAWAGVDVPAVRAGRVRVLDQPYVIAPSPRVPLALATLAAALH